MAIVTSANFKCLKKFLKHIIGLLKGTPIRINIQHLLIFRSEKRIIIQKCQKLLIRESQTALR